jgi:predicted RNA-binding Zn-ribbon protein involved in translation (DUF1610 family)
VHSSSARQSARHRRCPRCGRAWGGRPGATSRADDRTEVCPNCGVDEALRDAAGLPRLTRDDWPVRAPATAERGGDFDAVRGDYLAAVERVGRTLAPDEDWMPVLFLEGREGRTVVGLSDLLSAEPTKTFVSTVLMPALIRQADAAMFGLVTTAWVVASGEGSLDLPPSQHPDRFEACVLSVGNGARHEVWVAPITRDAKIILVGLDPRPRESEALGSEADPERELEGSTCA